MIKNYQSLLEPNRTEPNIDLQTKFAPSQPIFPLENATKERQNPNETILATAEL